MHCIENSSSQNCMNLNAKKMLFNGFMVLKETLFNWKQLIYQYFKWKNWEWRLNFFYISTKNKNWNKQINKISCTISNWINLLQTIWKPSFDYCCKIWGTCYKSGRNKFYKLLKKSARFIIEADIMTSSRLLFNV